MKTGPCGCRLVVASPVGSHSQEFPLSPAGWHLGRKFAKLLAQKDGTTQGLILCGTSSVKGMVAFSCTKNGFCHLDDSHGYETHTEPLAGFVRR